MQEIEFMNNNVSFTRLDKLGERSFSSPKGYPKLFN